MTITRHLAARLFTLVPMLGAGLHIAVASALPPAQPAKPSAAPLEQSARHGAATPQSTDLPVCRLSSTDPTRLAQEPCQPAPPHSDRRAVRQAIQRMPATPSPSAVPGVTYRPGPSPAFGAGTTPLPITGCDAAGCRDSSGVRHNGGVGNATIDPSGKVCQRSGAFLQCL